MLPIAKSVSPLLLLNIDDRSCSEPVDLGPVWLCGVKILKKHLSIFKVLNID